MNDKRYRMSFTSGGIFFHESLKLTELYLENLDWETVKKIALNDNILQTRTISSSKRLCREILFRLQTLSHNEIELLAQTNPQEQRYILWISICRLYRFIAEFAVELLRERYINLKNDLSFEEFDTFYNRKSEWHSELDQISTSTRKKLRQVLFRMLRESGLLSTSNTINGVILSPVLINAIPQDQKMSVLFFPVFDSDIRGYI